MSGTWDGDTLLSQVEETLVAGASMREHNMLPNPCEPTEHQTPERCGRGPRLSNRLCSLDSTLLVQVWEVVGMMVGARSIVVAERPGGILGSVSRVGLRDGCSDDVISMAGHVVRTAGPTPAALRQRLPARAPPRSLCPRAKRPQRTSRSRRCRSSRAGRCASAVRDNGAASTTAPVTDHGPRCFSVRR